MARNYAALPHEYLEEMAELTDAEFGRTMRALLRYSMTGEVMEPVGNERFYLRRVMAQEDRYQASYEELTQKRSEAGKKGAIARWKCKAILPDGKIGNTETETKPNQNYSTSSRRTGGRERAADAEREDRLRKDMVELERFMEQTKEGDI